MGRFQHEAAACDPVRRRIYLTEDRPDGKLYRFAPTTWGDLSAGSLQVAVVGWGNGAVDARTLPPARPFNGGEGVWYADGRVSFSTKGDSRVWELDVRSWPNRIKVLYDDDTSPHPVLTGVDNIVGARNGDLFVAEDAGNMEIVRLTRSGEVTPFLRVLEPARVRAHRARRSTPVATGCTSAPSEASMAAASPTRSAAPLPPELRRVGRAAVVA